MPAKTSTQLTGVTATILILAGEPLPGGLTAGSDSLPDSRPRDLVLPQYIDGALELVLGLLQAGRVDTQLVQQHFCHFAVWPNRELIVLSLRLENLVAKVHALVANEDTRTRNKPADLVFALATKRAAQ